MALKQRVITVIIGWAIIFGIIMFAPVEFFNAVICLIAVLSFNELLRMYKINEDTIFYRVAIIVFAGVCFAFLFWPQRNLVEASLVVAPFIILTTALIVPQKIRGSFEQTVKIIFSGVYVAFLFYFIMLRFIPMGRELVFVLSVGTWGRDVTAFIFGRLIKSGHVIIPTISSRKTYEGSIFALLFTVLVVILIAQWLLPKWTLVDKLIVGIGIGVLGQIGDLVESWIKRNAQASDSSQILPGQGGLLDSFDSFVFTAPAMYLYVTLIMTGQG